LKSLDDVRVLLVILTLLAGCAEAPKEERVTENPAAIAILPATEPPVSRIESTRPGRHDGAVLGTAGGAAGGAAIGYGAAGMLCTIGGPLCMIVVIPAAIAGALVGGTAGTVVDAINADPQRVERARVALSDAVAQVGTTEAVAKRTQQSAGPDATLLPAGEPDFAALQKRGIPTALQVAVTEFEVVPRERDMAIELTVRSRLYRTRDGQLLEQFEKTVHSDFRSYADWAANEAKPLREAIDAACAELGQSVSAVHLRGQPRAGTSARPGG
jgi:hypothetical protein